MKISIDSNCFGNLNFIDFLIEHRNNFEIHLSIIVFIETLIWYKLRGLKFDDFEADLKELKVKIDSLTEEIGKKISDIAITKNKTFPFNIHARDYFIGMIAEFNETTLITYNIKHFDWLQKDVLTPEELVKSFSDLEPNFDAN